MHNPIPVKARYSTWMAEVPEFQGQVMGLKSETANELLDAKLPRHIATGYNLLSVPRSNNINS